MRAGTQGNSAHAARRWIENVLHQMKADGFELTVKKGRGRPKKEMAIKAPDVADEGRAKTRSQSKSAGMMATINSLFRAPSLTTSPTKKEQRVTQKFKTALVRSCT